MNSRTGISNNSQMKIVQQVDSRRNLLLSHWSQPQEEGEDVGLDIFVSEKGERRYHTELDKDIVNIKIILGTGFKIHGPYFLSIS